MIAIRTLAAPILRKGEWDGFLTLVTDNLAKVVILPAILLGAFHMPPEIVFGKILLGLVFSIFVIQGAFVYMAKRLAKAEKRDDVTALPYGVSTPVMFVYLFTVMGPVYAATKDPLLTYRAGLGFAFIGGLVAMSGAFVGPFLQRITPKAGMLGTIAGVALVWIAILPMAIIFGNPLIGLPCLFIVLLGLIGRYRFPFGVPAGLVVIGLGVGIGLITGDATIHLESFALRLPIPALNDLWIGLRYVLSKPEILAVVIPVQIYNFMETIGNVETAKAAGDSYDVRGSLLLDGFGTCLASIFGSPFSTTVYLGHPAYKQMGARNGYTMMSGGFLLVAGLFGVFAFFQHLIPAASISALLVFVGLVMTHYAFQASPMAHGVAIVVAFIPHIADLLKKQLDGTLLEILPPTSVTPALAARLASNQGVYLNSYGLLSYGAIIVGLLWGSIVAFLVDGNLRKAMIFSLLAAFLSLFGVIHAERIGLYFSPITLGYLILTALLGLLQLRRPAVIQL